MLRVFHAGVLPEAGGEILLDPAESRHLVRVRRARVGDAVTVLDGRGAVAPGFLMSDDPPAARVCLGPFNRNPAPAPRILAVALPKGDTFGDIIRQAVELGATALQPLLTERTETHLDDPDRAARKRERWQATALEACKQSGNPWLPEIHPAAKLPAWLKTVYATHKEYLRFVAALTPDAQPLSERCSAASLREFGVVIAIGPEGDLTPAEYTLFKQAHFLSVRLPGHILRVETACAAALGLIGARFG